MKQYFAAQLKRLAKSAPAVIILSLALAVGFGLVLSLISATNTDATERKAVVAVTGEMEDTFLTMGITALSDFDTLSYSVEVVQTDTETAKNMLDAGQIAAYVVIPEGFAEKAAYGEFMTLEFVTTPGATGLVPMIKQEITEVISTILTHSNKGVYGMADAIESVGGNATYKVLTDLSFDYVDFILLRSRVYSVENLGVAYSLTLSGYFFCGLTTVLLFLLGIACAHIFVRKDTTLGRLLYSRGISAGRQLLGEYGAYFILMYIITALIIGVALVSGLLASVLPVIRDMTGIELAFIFVKLIPAVALICAFHFAVFEISTEPVSAVLFQFLFAAIIGYASGCIFPVWFFPEVLQKIAPFTPTGAARGYLAACFNGEDFFLYLALCIGFAVLFGGITLYARKQRILGRKEGNI